MAPDDARPAFAQAAAEDGIVLESATFDWLCEQGHVGLERVAKARRDPALVGPVTAALERLAAIYARLNGDVSVLHASRENLLLPVDLVHEPTGTVIEVDESRALHLVPPDGARALSGRRRRSASTSTSTRRSAARWCAEHRRARARPGRQGLRLRRRAAGARLPRRAARPRHAGDGPPAARPDRRRWTATAPPPTGATGTPAAAAAPRCASGAGVPVRSRTR